MKLLTYKDGAYKTNTGNVSLLSKTFPSFEFYRQVLMVVFKASSRAKRGRYDTAEWYKSSLAILHALESVGIKVEITGTDNIRTLDGPCVFLANHMSTLETFVLPVIIGHFKDITFVVKESLIQYPVFRHVMRSRDPVTVGRTTPREDLKAVLEGGTQKLKAGSSIIIFPQTTRATVFDPGEFNTIGIKLARKANTPVIPIAIKSDAWGTGRIIKDFGRIDPSRRVYFSFGEPIWIKGRGSEEHGRVIEFISSKLNQWGIPVKNR